MGNFFQNVGFALIGLLVAGCMATEPGNRSLVALSGAWGNAEGITGEEVVARYYRIDPQFTCAGAPAAYRDVLVAGATAFTQEGSACGESGPNSIPIAELETSYYNPRLVGYGAGIYEYLAETPTRSDSYIVAWCRDVGANATDGTDVVVRSEGEKLLATILRGSAAHPNGVFRVAPFPVTRETRPNGIAYSSSFAFRLEAGRVEIKIGGKIESFEIRCR